MLAGSAGSMDVGALVGQFVGGGVSGAVSPRSSAPSWRDEEELTTRSIDGAGRLNLPSRRRRRPLALESPANAQRRPRLDAGRGKGPSTRPPFAATPTNKRARSAANEKGDRSPPSFGGMEPC